MLPQVLSAGAAPVRRAVHVAGACIVFRCADGVPGRPWADLGPFLEPPPAGPDLEFEVDLAPQPWDDPAEEAPAFRYGRHNLAFELAAGRRRARAWFDGTRGAFDAVLELALHAALEPLDGLVVHASAGVIDGAAWVVPGRSGAGKSTFVRVAGFDRVLSDELVVLRRHAEGWRAWGTPFWSSGRTRPFDAGCAPVGLLIDPIKSDALAAAPWSPFDAAAGLLAGVTGQEDSADARRRAFELACDLAEAVPGARLAFPKEGPWVHAARTVLAAASTSRRSSGPFRSGCTGTSPGGATTSASTAI